MDAILPQLEDVTGRFPEKTIFTRFIPPMHAGDMRGAWQSDYEKWRMLTREHLPQELVNLVPSLARFVAPAKVFDKRTYSPWTEGGLHDSLVAEEVGSLAITGGETDVCVLAAVVGAIELGYRMVVLSDAVCSGADATHDATLNLLGNRFSVQLELLTTTEFLRTSSA
jgi:nicotinamidase-related amidase